MIGYMGDDNVPSKQVTLQYDAKSGFWYCTVDSFSTQFYASKKEAAIAGNKLALRTVGTTAQLLNA